MKEQIFFNDSTTDRLLGTIFSLTAEVYILRDRLSRMEMVFEQKGLLDPDAIENVKMEPNPARRESFIVSVLEPFLSGQHAASNVDERYINGVL